MRLVGWMYSAGLLVSACGLLAAQEPAAVIKPTAETTTKRQVSFTFDRKGMAVGHYRLIVDESGSGKYEGTEVPIATAYGHPVSQSAVPFQHTITISQATSQKIFSMAEKLNRFNLACASKLKNIADTGTKTLAYEGRDGNGNCTYNYSENKDVQTLTDLFQGIAETLDFGRQLDLLRRFDRLGLDATMKFLTDEVSSGHALEIGNIEKSLRSIAQDPDVMARVRNRATTLLNQSSGGAAKP